MIVTFVRLNLGTKATLLLRWHKLMHTTLEQTKNSGYTSLITGLLIWIKQSITGH